MPASRNDHAAAGSATGYLYQCRYALLAAVGEIPRRPHLSVSIERFDDVAFDNHGTPEEIIQTKHHPPRAGSLADGSVDLWKTLRIWTEIVRKNIDIVQETRFVLLTTGEAPDGSAASLLRRSHRDETRAGELLLHAARTYRNRETEVARKSFARLTADQQAALLSSVLVLDSSPDITDVRAELCATLSPAAPRGHVDHFVQRLEGWWFNSVIEALRNGGSSIPLAHIEDKMDELREGFKRDSLPVDFEGVSLAPEETAAYDKRIFVRQLQLVKIGEKRISYAIRDYYRAFAQRGRWVREELLFDPEIAGYELALEEEWQPRFAEICDEVGEIAAEEDKASAGRRLYRWAEQDASVPLRTVTNRFLCHGSYQMLADARRIGWHPDFDTILHVETPTTR